MFVRNGKRDGQSNLINSYELTSDPVIRERERMREQDIESEIVPTGSESNRSSHSSVGVTKSIWSSDIYGYKDRIGGAPLAHLVPASATLAMTWWFVADMVFGRNNWTWKERAMLLNGSRASPEGSRKFEHCGIKHMATNKARIPSNLFFFDNIPCILVLPIMTSDQTRAWRGEAFHALVVIDAWKKQNCKLGEVANLTFMKEKGWCAYATNAEIDTAGTLLREIMLAIRYSLMHTPDDMEKDFYERMKRFGVSIPRLDTNYFFPVPYKRKYTDPRVRKVEFAAATDWEDDVRKANGTPRMDNLHELCRHMAPDPMLLAARAALTFATRRGNKFAAGAEPPEEDEMDTRAHELFLRDLLATRRPPDNREDLARALGQPLVNELKV